MDVLVGSTLNSFILGTRFLLVRTGVAQSVIAEVRFSSYKPLQCFNSTQDDRCFQYWGRRSF